METAGEGGAWGIAVLALYMAQTGGESLSDYLNHQIFAGEEGSTVQATTEEIAGFDTFMKKFHAALTVEQAAVDAL